jgi:hypothetical protein
MAKRGRKQKSKRIPRKQIMPSTAAASVCKKRIGGRKME